jgi:hypothetical protein
LISLLSYLYLEMVSGDGSGDGGGREGGGDGAVATDGRSVAGGGDCRYAATVAAATVAAAMGTVVIAKARAAAVRVRGRRQQGR